MLIDQKLIEGYREYLIEQERSEQTISKYISCLKKACGYFADTEVTKQLLVEYKRQLSERYGAATVNVYIAAINGLLKSIGRDELCIRPLKVQRALFVDDTRELSRAEYDRLVDAAENEQINLIVQTICSTGIRISELKWITVESARSGKAYVANKGKRRVVFLPRVLCAMLKKYAAKQKLSCGAIFVTRNGKPVDRSNVWRAMKRLGAAAGVADSKVFPHNLRHLFAQTFYSRYKDISRLADILGHSNISTTRIYTAESGYVHAKQLDEMGLLRC